MKLSVSGLIIREDDEGLQKRVEETNKIIKSFAKDSSWTFIDNTNIDRSCLNRSGLHLNRKGSAKLAMNFVNAINESA